MKTKTKIYIPDTSEYCGKVLTLADVQKKIEEKYISTGKYRFADLYEVDTDDLPQEGYVWYYFFKSLVRNSGGYWDVPNVCRGSSEWNRNADWLGRGWRSIYRVVLLETSLTETVESLESLPDDLVPLKLRIEKLEAWAKQIGYK